MSCPQVPMIKTSHLNLISRQSNSNNHLKTGYKIGNITYTVKLYGKTTDSEGQEVIMKPTFTAKNVDFKQAFTFMKVQGLSPSHDSRIFYWCNIAALDCLFSNFCRQTGHLSVSTVYFSFLNVLQSFTLRTADSETCFIKKTS